jgi:8-oxo-dGTP pyrophosphatase MutT (NUDIX family)
MIHVSVQNKPLFLVDKINAAVDEYLHRPTTIFIDEVNAAAVRTMLQELEDPRFYTGVLLHSDLSALLEAVKKELTVLVAAGGLVYTPTNELLLINRLGRWDLPKGKLDPGESLEACALREIEEETGAAGLSIDHPLQVTYHTYHQNGTHYLKESHWFLIKAAKKSALQPQTEEDITECLWVPLKEIEKYIAGAFPTIVQVLRKGIEVLQPLK